MVPAPRPRASGTHRQHRSRSEQPIPTLLLNCQRPETPPRLAYEWTPTTGEFRVVTDPRERQFEENWLAVLTGRTAAVTHKEIRAVWPSEGEKPSETALYEWLNAAFAKQLVRRSGQGTKSDPWRYRLPNEDDAYYDRGELPPLKPLFG